jgi:hypothetical protein
MSSRGDEIKKCMNTVVSESRVTLNPGFLSENVVILALEVAHNFLEAKSK